MLFLCAKPSPNSQFQSTFKILNMVYMALYSLFPATSLISSPTILYLAHQLQRNWLPWWSPNSSMMPSSPAFYTCYSLCLEPSSPRCTHSLLLHSLQASAQISPYQRKVNTTSLSILCKRAYILPSFSVSIPCTVFLYSIPQFYYLLSVSPPIFQNISSMPSGPLLILSSLPLIIVHGT